MAGGGGCFLAAGLLARCCVKLCEEMWLAGKRDSAENPEFYSELAQSGLHARRSLCETQSNRCWVWRPCVGSI